MTALSVKEKFDAIDSVNIGFEPMPMERFKELFFDPCPKARIPEVLKCLSDDHRKAFEAYLKEQADAEETTQRDGLTPIEYDPIPCVANAYIIFENDERETWSAVVSEAGKLECIIDSHGNRYTSMEALKDRFISAFTLEFEHTVGLHVNCE